MRLTASTAVAARDLKNMSVDWRGVGGGRVAEVERRCDQGIIRDDLALKENVEEERVVTSEIELRRVPCFAALQD